MEVGLPPSKTGYAPVPPPKGYAPPLPSKTGYAPAGHRPTPPSTPNKTVNFSINPDTEKKREKFLTAKYGAHQMALIRKRLRVEMWMYDQLQTLYTSEEEGAADVEIDLDEVLDMEDDTVRKTYLKDLLSGSKSTKELINKFVDELLEKAKTL